MERREAIKVMAIGALGALMGLPRLPNGEVPEVEITNSEGGGIITGVMPPKPLKQTLDGIVEYFRDMRKMGYDTVLCCDDPKRLRIGWLFGKDIHYVSHENPFHSNHVMFNPQIQLEAFKDIAKTDGELGAAFAMALETDEGRINLIETLKRAAGWPA